MKPDDVAKYWDYVFGEVKSIPSVDDSDISKEYFEDSDAFLSHDSICVLADTGSGTAIYKSNGLYYVVYDQNYSLPLVVESRLISDLKILIHVLSYDSWCGQEGADQDLVMTSPNPGACDWCSNFGDYVVTNDSALSKRILSGEFEDFRKSLIDLELERIPDIIVS